MRAYYYFCLAESEHLQAFLLLLEHRLDVGEKKRIHVVLFEAAGHRGRLRLEPNLRQKLVQPSLELRRRRHLRLQRLQQETL